MMPTSIPNDNAAVVKYGAQQHSYKNGQHSHYDKSRRRTGITPQNQDELGEAATRSTQISSNHSLRVTPSYMATKRKDKPLYPVINDVRTLQIPEQGTIQQGGIPTVVHSPPSETSSAIQPAYNGQLSLKDTQIMTPQRPQDLLHDVSLDVARVNVKSSAQYRKSYAFKIWRDKGSFPYRIAEQPVVKEVGERKKSKKYLNAIRAQKDRVNEEEWKQFKSYRTTNDDMRYRRTTKFPRVQVEETLMKQHEKEQLNTILSDSQEKDLKARNIKHQNSIPHYFKNKKESAQKSQSLVSPTKSIPTSVIHVNTTKACDVSKQTSQAEQTMITFSRNVYNRDVLKSTTQAGVGPLIYNPTSEEKLFADVEEYGSISQWSGAQTSSAGKYNIPHSEEQLNAVNGRQRISTETMSASGYGSAESSSSLGGSILPNIPSIQQKHHYNKHFTSPSVTTNLNGFADNSTSRDEDMKQLSTKCNDKIVSDQSPTPSPVETVKTSVNSEIDSSNLASIIKNSLAKKYSKENVKPNFGSGERGRKRARNESASSSEEGERQRTRMKQEKASMFTRLNEAVATNLADGIHNVNSEYFPIEALAKKAAKETSKDNADVGLENKLQTTSIKHKVDEIERARLLLKELFDVTSESGGDNEMKTFDVASRSFGRKNILNHLSLIDRYFAEFQKKLSNTERAATSLP